MPAVKTRNTAPSRSKTQLRRYVFEVGCDVNTISWDQYAFTTNEAVNASRDETLPGVGGHSMSRMITTTYSKARLTFNRKLITADHIVAVYDSEGTLIPVSVWTAEAA
jgi:hypothetical protein